MVFAAVGAFFSYQNRSKEQADAASVAHTHRGIETLDTLLTDLIDAETGERGFLLTGRNSYLQPYTAALSHLNSDFDLVRELTADNSGQQRKLDRMKSLIATELVGMRNSIAIRRKQKSFNGPANSPIGAERQRMDRIRSLIAQMRKEEEGLLQQRLEAASSDSRKTRFVILSGNLLGLLLLGAAGFLIHGEMNRCRIIERDLRVSEDRFKGILESAPDAIVIVNRAGRIAHVNSQTEKMFGYARTALLGKPVEMLMPEGVRHAHEDHRAGYFSNPQSRPMGMGMELRGMRQDGTGFPLEISLGQVETNEGKLVCAAVRDITMRVQMEQEIKIRNAQLEAANKELEAFCYSVSHDLRAPLRSIDGFSQALIEDQADRIDAPGKAHLERIRAATRRMGELIDDLLSLSRVTRAEISRKPTNLSEMAGSIAAELRRQQPEREVEFVVAPGLTANADPRLMRIVLENLLGNSWKFTSKREHAHVEFGRTEENGSSAFFVRDNGAGFDPAYSGRLFGAFQRLHPSSEFPGTGIGLATVQRIIHRHGGKVWGEGQVEGGATFYFRL